ncbi:hypothetical protein KF840_04020 [bacterium]|nr:hypothetical protein [bacterium]
MANVAPLTDAVSVCEAGDANRDGQITIGELVTAVRHALDGCPLVG